MSDIRFNINGFYEIRTMGATRRLLEAHGRRVTTAANNTLHEGRGYKMSSHLGARRPQGRWRVAVYADSIHAKRSNAKRNTLIRVLHG